MRDESSEPIILERVRARLNRTVAALMQRGMDVALAERLRQEGQTLGSLQQAHDTQLRSLGLSDSHITAVRRGGRAVVPFIALARVLWANRFTCCVCRDHNRAVILHHIRPWAQSHDHSERNLAVLCLDHHAQAHRKGDLEQNLTARQLSEFKAKWEEEVKHLDPKAILDASRLEGFHWWWFNHLRMIEMADQLRLNARDNTHFFNARAAGWIDSKGHLTSAGQASHYLYEGGLGQHLYRYMRHVLEAVLSRAAVFNISDDLDPGFLSRVVTPGDILVVTGKHYFKSRARASEGPGQASEVRREANRVRVSFLLDRWEAVSSSAWALWLTGAKRASSIVRVGSVEREGSRLHLLCTGLAMGGELHGLSTRSYAIPTWPEPDIDEDEDHWLDFGAEIELS
jgi:hypothetical protein